MAGNAQKTPLAISLQNLAQKKAQDAISLMGKALPAKIVAVMGPIVTVNFLVQTTLFTLPNCDVPLAGSEYARAPIQPGCTGVVMAIDVYLGGVSGLGGGVADLSLPGNLASLVFFPIGNTGFSTTDDANAFVLYGPDGVILRDSQSRIKLKLQATVAELDLPAGVPLVINGDVHVSGAIIAGFGGADQVGQQTHTHPGNNLPPTPGT